jgi:MscS family membrane protein
MIFCVVLAISQPWISHTAQAAGAEAIDVFFIDQYSKQVEPDGQSTYNWTIQNQYSNVSLTVVVTMSISGRGWSATVVSDNISIGPGELGGVHAVVVAPHTSASSSSNLTVRLSVYDRGYLVQIAEIYAVTEYVGSNGVDKVLGAFDNPLPSPLDNAWGVFLLDVCVWLALAIMVLLGIIPLLKEIGSRTKTRVAGIVIKTIRTPLIVLVVLYGTIQSLSVLDDYFPSSLRESLLKMYQVALTIILLYLAYKLFREVVVHVAKQIASRTQTQVDDMLVPLLEKVGLVVIGLAGLGLLLGYMQVDLTLFVAGGVVTSMVIAFAAQDTLSNFFSGLFILTDQPFKEHDVIILSDGDWAEVRRIGMRTTRLFRFSDATIITIPNNKLVNEKIANFSNPQDMGRLMKTFNVAYGSDIMKVRKIINEAINDNPHIIKEDPLKPIIRFDAMSESSLDFFVLVWLDSRDNRFSVTDYLNTEIYSRFNKAGIDIPFPQRTIHLKMAEQSVPLEIERLSGKDKGSKGRKSESN